MARISGITIPSEKQVWVALTYVYGIGQKSSQDILKKANVDPTQRVNKLTDSEISRIQDVISSDYIVEGDLQKIVSGNIKRLKDIKSYRGQRHEAKLPSRGQRTRTNARTRRGKRIAVAGTAKKAPTKT